MNMTDAIVFLPRGAGGEAPTLLEALLFTPGAVWLAEALKHSGVGRFLVVCHGGDRERAARCFPEGTTFITGEPEDANQKMTAFLSGTESGVAVITGAVFLTREGAQRLSAPEPLPSGEPTGVFRADAAVLLAALAEGAGLTDAARARGETFGRKAGRFEGVLPIGSSWQSREEAALFARRAEVARLAGAGVRFIDPAGVYVDPTVTVGEGTVLLPGTILRGRTAIGRNCEIGPNSMVRDCAVGDGVVINASQCNESIIGSHAKIGPFAYIRPGCAVGANTKVGDFVEVKNSTIGDGTKISHLTYVGDSDLGKNVNLGCGTVTVNYDGTSKFRTVVGDNAFVGCNTNLVAPVSVGSGAYIAAGSTITENVPADGLAIARALQTVKPQWAARRKKK